MKKNKVVIVSLLSSFSLILSQISHYLKVIPGVPMITLDFSDVPIFTSMMLFKPLDAYIMLIIVSAIRCILFSSAGWPGIIMRVSVTSIAIFIMSIYKKYNKRFFIFCILASVLSTIIKLPINYIFWTKLFSMSPQYVKSILFSIVMPTNFIKMITNISISNLLNKKIQHISEKIYKNRKL